MGEKIAPLVIDCKENKNVRKVFVKAPFLPYLFSVE
jgi:hypothetical protein